MRPLWQAGDFIRAVRRELRFGELSRAPLRLVSLEWRGDWALCEWMARAADAWDAGISPVVRDRRMTEQALKDAMEVRTLLFSALPGVNTANLRVYREAEPPELIIAGTVMRESPALPGVRSTAMRVKLCGLHFQMEDGKLEPLLREGPT
jgi:hypothetical protein